MHPQETLVQTFDYHGIRVDLLEWTDTLWCGKIGYAQNCTDEPDVEQIATSFPHDAIPNDREPGWNVCITINYLSHNRPSGVMFGFLVSTAEQPECFDLVRFPSAQYMRIRICDETAKYLDREPWLGGIPPYDWIGELIAPHLGYTYGEDILPIFEYYGDYHPVENYPQVCYLYVPVQKL